MMGVKFTFTPPPGGANASVAGAALVLRPNAPAGPLPPNVFRTWADLYAVYALTSGETTISFDNTYGACSIGPAGNYEIRADTVLTADLRINVAAGFDTTVTVVDGVKFVGNYLYIDGLLKMVSISSSPVMEVVAGNGIVRVVAIRGAHFRADGTAPFFRVAVPGLGPTFDGFFFILILGGGFESGGNTVLDMPSILPDPTFAQIILSTQAVVDKSTISGAGMAFLGISLQDVGAFMSFDQPGFVSTFGPLNQINNKDNPPNQNWNPSSTPGGGPPILASANHEVILISTGGGLSISLPASTSVFNGANFRTHNTSGVTSPATLTPAPGDTINGSASPFVTPGTPNEDYEFTIDLASKNWVVRCMKQLQQQTFAVDFGLVSFPPTGDFPNGTPAVIASDAVNPGITEAQFAVFIAPISVYWDGYVPVWARRMRVQIVHRSVSGGPGNLGLSFYNRAVLNGAAVGGWMQTIMPDIAFSDTVPHYDVIAPAAGETLADWGMVPAVSGEGTMYQFIVERNVAPTTPPNLPGDWCLFAVILTFSE